MYIIIYFVTLYCKTERGEIDSLGGKILQPLGVTKIPLRGSKKVSRARLKKQTKKTGEGNDIAGNQVNEALADCQAAREKHAYYHRQVQVLYDAYTGTHELMDNGKANYLEVLTAQESLLNAQLSEAMNMYKGAQAVIALYIALGGGTK